MPEDILVNWQMTEPPLAAKVWHRWQVADFAALGQQPSLEGVVGVAFRKKLTRYDGWDLSGLPSSLQGLCKEAAAVFRRGVAVKGEIGRSLQGQYPITLARAQNLVDKLLHEADAFHIVDKTWAELWPQLGFTSQHSYRWLADERRKNLAAIEVITQAWKKSGRRGRWLIWGGGILADTAAFAAACQQQPFVLIPTTLLAMVDACVGGKTGVNAPPFGKNQVGRFAFPQAVVVHPAFLTTLPRRELRAGAAEALKHAFLTGDETLLQGVVDAAAQQSEQKFEPLLLRLIACKAAIVEQDPSEQGVRVILNLGHTLAHALEAYSHAHRPAHAPLLLHGEAVAWGLAFAVLLSQTYAGLPSETAQLCLQALKDSGCLLPRSQLEELLGAPLNQDGLWDELWQAMLQDKKQQGGSQSVTWVLLTRLGLAREASAQYTWQLTKHEVEPAWQQLLQLGR